MQRVTSRRFFAQVAQKPSPLSALTLAAECNGFKDSVIQDLTIQAPTIPGFKGLSGC